MSEIVKTELCRTTEDSVLAGVCGGIARRFNIESWIVRTGFVLGILMIGLSPILYLICAFSFPKDSEAHDAYNAKILGVCSRLAKKMDWDIAIVRSVFTASLILSLIPSFGTTLIIYFIMHFVLPEYKNTAPNVVTVKTKDIN